MNQAASFGLLAVGGIAVTKAITGASFADVVKGRPGAVPSSGSSLASTGVAGAGAAAVNAATPSSPASVAAAVKQVATGHGWGASEIEAWLGVIAHEDASGSLTAKNPTSSAYGIAQFINGPSEYATYGGDVSTVIGQVTAMGNYIEQRYGTPSAALAHEQSFGWY